MEPNHTSTQECLALYKQINTLCSQPCILPKYFLMLSLLDHAYSFCNIIQYQFFFGNLYTLYMYTVQ